MKIGIIGAGRMGHTHARELHALGVPITAVCDIQPDRAQFMADMYGAQVYPTDQALLDDAGVDAVYVTTPTRDHIEPVVRAAERGVHLFVEKPLAFTLAEAEEAARAVEKAGVISCVGYHWRYTEAVQQAEALVQDQPIALLACRWYWTLPPIEWLRNKDLGGGQIVDQITHLIDLAQHLGGPVDRVYAAYALQTRTDAEFHNWDGYAVTLTFGSGAVGTVTGTYALFPQISERPHLDLALRERMLRITPEGLEVHTAAGIETFANTRPFYRGLNETFVRAVREGRPDLVRTPIRAGLLSLAVTLAANHSAATGEIVRMDQFMSQGNAV
ncbi:MAG: Gfo/Idh/MocA family oxidoreductase [Anaerolineae bacterium]|nr:Gfo/Idh/MocA family oxidoreductase [Anaerolineae bacterium]